MEKRGSAPHLDWVIFVNGAPHAETITKHKRGQLLVHVCPSLLWSSDEDPQSTSLKNPVKIRAHICFHTPSIWACKVKTTHYTWSWSEWAETFQSQFNEESVPCVCLSKYADHMLGQRLRQGETLSGCEVVSGCWWDQFSRNQEYEGWEKSCSPTWLRARPVFCSHALHWSYSLMDMLLQPDACLRTQPKNCLSSLRRVEFSSPGGGSHELRCSHSEKGRRRRRRVRRKKMRDKEGEVVGEEVKRKERWRSSVKGCSWNAWRWCTEASECSWIISFNYYYLLLYLKIKNILRINLKALTCKKTLKHLLNKWRS